MVMETINEKEIKRFFESNKESVKDDGFVRRVSEQLNYYPQPQALKKNVKNIQRNIVLISSYIGVIIFACLGGISFILKNAIPFVGIPSAANNYLINPLNITASLLLALLMAAVIYIPIKIIK